MSVKWSGLIEWSVNCLIKCFLLRLKQFKDFNTSVREVLIDEKFKNSVQSAELAADIIVKSSSIGYLDDSKEYYLQIDNNNYKEIQQRSSELKSSIDKLIESDKFKETIENAEKVGQTSQWDRFLKSFQGILSLPRQAKIL